MPSACAVKTVYFAFFFLSVVSHVHENIFNWWLRKKEEKLEIPQLPSLLHFYIVLVNYKNGSLLSKQSTFVDLNSKFSLLLVYSVPQKAILFTNEY